LFRFASSKRGQKGPIYEGVERGAKPMKLGKRVQPEHASAFMCLTSHPEVKDRRGRLLVARIRLA